MDKIANLDDQERREIFQEVANSKGINVAIIEKDFWVCWILQKIFSNDAFSEILVFKGGTSLSKVYQIINRFSEDIDLVLNPKVLQLPKDLMSLRPKAISNSEKQRERNRISEKANDYLESDLGPKLKKLLESEGPVTVTVERENVGNTDINIEYPKTSSLPALRPQVKLEIGPLASLIPSNPYTMTSYVAEEFPDQFSKSEISLPVINAERTFWEKATILHERASKGRGVTNGYSRHYYDLYCLAKSSIRGQVINDLELLDEVVKFKNQFYYSAGAQFDRAKPPTFKLLPNAELSKELEDDYIEMAEMIYGIKPTWEEIIAALGILETEINKQ